VSTIQKITRRKFKTEKKKYFNNNKKQNKIKTEKETIQKAYQLNAEVPTSVVLLYFS